MSLTLAIRWLFTPVSIVTLHVESVPSLEGVVRCWTSRYVRSARGLCILCLRDSASPAEYQSVGGTQPGRRESSSSSGHSFRHVEWAPRPFSVIRK